MAIFTSSINSKWWIIFCTVFSEFKSKVGLQTTSREKFHLFLYDSAKKQW